MRIKVTCNFEGELRLPFSYHYAMQSAIYHTLQEHQEYQKLHDGGYAYEKRLYKGFTFSGIEGRYRIKEKRICFQEQCYFYVSSMDDSMLQIIAESFEKEGIELLHQRIDNIVVETIPEPEGIWNEKIVDCKDEVECGGELVDINLTQTCDKLEKLSCEKGSNDEMIQNEAVDITLTIDMLSPICARKTDIETKKSIYYEPGDEMFASLVADNFVRKYTAVYGEEPDSGITITPVLVLPRHKKKVEYRRFLYEGWLGKYQLSGKPEYLKFLYEVGLGSENAKGFGMFEVEGIT